MKRLFIAGLAALAITSPAHATGGLVCEATSGEATAYVFVISHTASSPIYDAYRHSDAGQQRMTIAQSWITDEELKVDLTDEQAIDLLARIIAFRNGDHYVGTLIEGEMERPIRCEEA